ncbi:MAG: hypothetical protein ACJ8HJ_01350 [Massilia sp.]|jgi:hypothetical protein
MKALLAVAIPFVLAGCASTTEPAAADMPALGAASTATTDAAVPITGSRIPAKRTEKMVSQIGGKDYKDNKSSLMAPLQSN